MFTDYTFTDWSAATEDKRDLITKIINAYKGSADFKDALVAQKYFRAENIGIKNKFLVKLDASEVTNPETGVVTHVTRELKVEGNRVASDFFHRFVVQENQHLLGNGVSLGDTAMKKRLGFGFDTVLQRIGQRALVAGVCWGFWNHDHLEMIEAVKDAESGAAALVDEETGVPRVLVQFWKLGDSRPLHARVFDDQGIVSYKADEDGKLQETARSAYRQTVSVDKMGIVDSQGSGYSSGLPVVPLYADDDHASRLRPSLRSKIDAFDRIVSDFADNLEMANDVIWVLNNFGGDRKEILETLQQIHELRAVANISDGTGSGSTAEPYTYEVPHAARQTALEILRKELYRDAMALDTEALSGVTLSTEAIEVAYKELNLKCDLYEWQVFEFMQQVLALSGARTEDISFKRQNLINISQTIENIYTAAEDLDRRTRLQKNPMVMDEEIAWIMEAKAAEDVSGLSDVETLQREIDAEADRFA